MNTNGTVNSNNKTAKIVGALFIISTAAGVLNLGFLVPLLRDPDYLINIFASENKWVIGALLDLICAGAFVGLAVMIFPILKEHNERMAIGYIVARSFEAVPFVFGVISLLSLLTLSQEYVLVGAPDASYFQTLGAGLRATYDWTQMLGGRVFASLAALPFYYLLYQSRLLPRWIAVWGIVGAPLYLVSGLLPMFGLVGPSSTILVLLFLPAALLEMVLAVWLIVKGFGSSEIASSSLE